MEMAAVKYQLRFVREKLKDMKKKDFFRLVHSIMEKLIPKFPIPVSLGKKKKKKVNMLPSVAL